MEVEKMIDAVGKGFDQKNKYDKLTTMVNPPPVYKQPELFYIISLKHTSKGDAALTFWGKNGGGYTWHKDRAGLYTEEQAKKCTSEDSVAVPQEDVEKFWMNALDFNDQYVSVPNNPTVLHHLKLDGKYMKPKRMASCRMVFINTPVK